MSRGLLVRWFAASVVALIAAGCRERTPEPEARPRLDAQPIAPATATLSEAGPPGPPPAFQGPPNPQLRRGDRLLFDKVTPYSHVRVADNAGRRSLLFVRDRGVEVVESTIELDRPDLLDIAYTRAMFVTLLFKPSQQRALLVGLGGGSMVRFSNRFFPETQLDVVEIDPVIVQVAADYFGVHDGPKARIIVEDGFKYLAQAGEQYDAIYIDAFVKPAMDTDVEGMPLRLKTKQFLQGMQKRLVPDGVVAINLNDQPHLREDVSIIRESFPHFYYFPVLGTGNYIAVGSMVAVSDEQIQANARAIDARPDHKYGFTFGSLAAMKENP